MRRIYALNAHFNRCAASFLWFSCCRPRPSPPTTSAPPPRTATAALLSHFHQNFLHVPCWCRHLSWAAIPHHGLKPRLKQQQGCWPKVICPPLAPP